MYLKQLHLVGGDINKVKKTKQKRQLEAAAGTPFTRRGDEEKQKEGRVNNDKKAAGKRETFTVKRRLWRKITINLVKG